MNLKDEVKWMLEALPYCRDNDNRLIVEIWNRYVPHKFHPKQYGLSHFLAHFADGKYPSPESIRRVRQKLQQHYPELRGYKYEARQTRSRHVARAMKENPGYV